MSLFGLGSNARYARCWGTKKVSDKAELSSVFDQIVRLHEEITHNPDEDATESFNFSDVDKKKVISILEWLNERGIFNLSAHAKLYFPRRNSNNMGAVDAEQALSQAIELFEVKYDITFVSIMPSPSS